MSRSTHRRARRLAATLAASLLLVGSAACSTEKEDAERNAPSSTPDGSPEESPEESPDEPTTPAGAETEPGSFDLEAGVELPKPSYRIALGSTHAVTYDGARLRGTPIGGDGEAWEGEELPGKLSALVADSSGEELTAIGVAGSDGSGTRVGRDTVHVLTVSPQDGGVRTEATFRVPRSPAAPEEQATAALAATDGSVVVLDVATQTEPARHRTVAVDTAAGEVLWSRDGVAPLAVADGTVLTRTSTAPGDVSGLRLGNGKTRWRGLPNTHAATALGAYDGLVSIARDGAFGTHVVVTVRAATGQVRHERPVDATRWSCVPSSTAVSVCRTPENGVTGWDVTKAREVWHLPTRRRQAPLVTAVHGDRVYGSLGSQGWVALDVADGKDAASGQGPTPSTVNDAGAVFNADGSLVWAPVR